MSKEILKERAINMTINPTKAEKRFMELLELNNLEFRQQVICGRFIIDFVVNNHAIELDGSSHIGKEEYDLERGKYIIANGFNLIRILNKDVDSFNFEILKTRGKKQGYYQALNDSLRDKSWKENLNEKQKQDFNERGGKQRNRKAKQIEKRKKLAELNKK